MEDGKKKKDETNVFNNQYQEFSIDTLLLPDYDPMTSQQKCQRYKFWSVFDEKREISLYKHKYIIFSEIKSSGRVHHLPNINDHIESTG